jgi:uncharacterized protein YcbX
MSVYIAELGLQPGKSMRHLEAVEALRFDREGMFDDREVMWVEAAEHTNVTYHPGEVASPGRFLSQREDPILTQITAEIGADDSISLGWSEPGDSLWLPRVTDDETHRVPVSVWGWNGFGVDQGDNAAEWGADHIGRPVRLVAVSDESPRYVEGNPELGRVGFADGYPLHITSTASIAKLNEYLESVGRPTIPANRFRADIILGGLEAFEEDRIDTITFETSGLSMVMRCMKACGRCPIPDTDQVTGVRKTHVRSALGKIGRKGVHANSEKYGSDSEIFFGDYFVIEMPQGQMGRFEEIAVSLGQEPVDITFADKPTWVAVSS